MNEYPFICHFAKDGEENHLYRPSNELKN